jgi:hypothetical protein
MDIGRKPHGTDTITQMLQKINCVLIMASKWYTESLWNNHIQYVARTL